MINRKSQHSNKWIAFTGYTDLFDITGSYFNCLNSSAHNVDIRAQEEIGRSVTLAPLGCSFKYRC